MCLENHWMFLTRKILQDYSNNRDDAGGIRKIKGMVEALYAQDHGLDKDLPDNPSWAERRWVKERSRKINIKINAIEKVLNEWEDKGSEKDRVVIYNWNNEDVEDTRRKTEVGSERDIEQDSGTDS